MEQGHVKLLMPYILLLKELSPQANDIGRPSLSYAIFHGLVRMSKIGMAITRFPLMMASRLTQPVHKRGMPCSMEFKTSWKAEWNKLIKVTGTLSHSIW